MEHNSSAVDVFKRFLERVKSKKIPLVSLRPKEISESKSYEGDYDYFLPPIYVNELLQIVFDLAVSENISFTINRYKHGKAVIILHNRTDNQSIFLEVWNMLSVKDPYKKSIRYIYAEQLSPHIYFNEDQDACLPLEVEALYYLSHLYTGGKKLSTPLVHERINHYRTFLGELGSVYAVWYENLASGVMDIKSAAHLANMELIEKNILFSKSVRSLIQEGETKIASSMSRFKRQWLRFLKTIPVVGPDGVGKTTFIEGIVKKATVSIGSFRFKKLFRSSPFYRLLFPLLQSVLRKRANDNKFIGKTEVDDQFAMIVFLNAFLMSPFRLFWNILIRRVMLVDRYFHDYLLTNIRIQNGSPGLRPNWKMFLYWIPQQYWFIQLDASTEVILSRKTELSAAGISSYRYDVFKMYLEKPFMIYTYINTETTSEQCSDLIFKIADTVADIKL